MLKYQRISFESVAAVVFGLNALCGNAPFTYQRRTQLFRSTRLHLIYPVTITTMYIGLHVHYYSDTLTNASLMHQLLIVCRYILVSATLVQNCINRRRLVAHLNAGRVTLARVGRQCKLHSLPFRYGGLVVWVAAQIVMSGALTMYGSFGMFDVSTLGHQRATAAAAVTPTAASATLPSVSFLAGAIIVRIFSYLMQSVTVNSFYVLMWIVQFYFERVVEHIDAVMREASELSEAASGCTAYERMRRFGELSERLDALCAIHRKLVGMCRRHNRLVSVQLLLAIGFMLLVLVTQLIIIYDIVTDGEVISGQQYSYMAAYAMGVLCELYRLSSGCAKTVQMVSGPIHILSEVFQS